jgi:hypothetical protein
MAIEEPVAVYNAATNVEAHLVKMQLVEAGIEAFVVEDLSTGGLWMFGLLPGIHKPQVWVKRSDVERAQPLLADHVQHPAERQPAGARAPGEPGPPIEVVCEECGHKSSFPADQRGSVQDCPHCGAYVDVGEIDPFWLDKDPPVSP